MNANFNFFGLTGFPAFVLIAISCFLLWGIPAIKIARRLGFGKGWWGALFAIPFISTIVVWVFAFMDWPNDKGDNK